MGFHSIRWMGYSIGFVTHLALDWGSFLFVLFSWNQNTLRTWGDLRTNGRICRSSLYWFCLGIADGFLNRMYQLSVIQFLERVSFFWKQWISRMISWELVWKNYMHKECVLENESRRVQRGFSLYICIYIYDYNNLAREPE